MLPPTCLNVDLYSHVTVSAHLDIGGRANCKRVFNKNHFKLPLSVWVIPSWILASACAAVDCVHPHGKGQLKIYFFERFNLLKKRFDSSTPINAVMLK